MPVSEEQRSRTCLQSAILFLGDGLDLRQVATRLLELFEHQHHIFSHPGSVGNSAKHFLPLNQNRLTVVYINCRALVQIQLGSDCIRMKPNHTTRITIACVSKNKLYTMGNFTFCISLSLRPKTETKRSQLWSQSDVEFNQSQPRVIADVIGNSSLISQYFFVMDARSA